MKLTFDERMYLIALLAKAMTESAKEAKDLQLAVDRKYIANINRIIGKLSRDTL